MKCKFAFTYVCNQLVLNTAVFIVLKPWISHTEYPLQKTSSFTEFTLRSFYINTLSFSFFGSTSLKHTKLVNHFHRTSEVPKRSWAQSSEEITTGNRNKHPEINLRNFDLKNVVFLKKFLCNVITLIVHNIINLFFHFLQNDMLGSRVPGLI